MKHFAGLTVLFLLCLPARAFPDLQEVREVHYQMGTFLELTLWHSDRETAKQIIRNAVKEVHRLETILSDFDPDSALSRLNRQAGRGRIKIPPELYDVLTTAHEFGAKTSGDFDVTVGPLMSLWRESSSRGRPPARDSLARVLGRIGYQKIRLYDSREAELLVPGMKVDLGGIGKGYAVDRVVERLQAAGINAGLINFGGSSIYAVGAPPGQQHWEVGLEGPEGRVRGLIHLRDTALSTSGSLGKFWSIGDKKYGHLIDPKSGVPVSGGRTTTVIASSATAAEALTKALILRGKEALRTVVQFPGAEAVVISDDGPLFFSDGFKFKTNWQEIPSL